MKKIIGAIVLGLLLALFAATIVGCAANGDKGGGISGTDDGWSKQDRIKAKNVLKVQIMPEDAPLPLSSDHITNVSKLMAIGKAYQALEHYKSADVKAIFGSDFVLSTVFQPDPDHLTRQLVDGHVAWVGMLTFKNGEDEQGSFKQFKGISPGIIVVDAEDESKGADIRLRNAEGKPYKIVFSFRDDFHNPNYIYVWLRDRGYGKILGEFSTDGTDPILDDITLEIEDGTWNPYFTLSVDRNKIHREDGKWVGLTPEKVVVVDAQSDSQKDVKEYVIGKDKVPDWIDRVYSQKSMVELAGYWGYDPDTFLRLSHKGNLVVDGGEFDEVLDDTGKNFVYIATMTSQLNDDSAAGIMVISTKEAKAQYFPMRGDRAMATKDMAQQVMKNSAPRPNWNVEDVTLNWVSSRPTWEGVYTTPVKFAMQVNGKPDEAGGFIEASIPMGVVLAEATDHLDGMHVVWSTTKSGAFAQYENLVFMNNQSTSNVNQANLVEYDGEGTIEYMNPPFPADGHPVYMFRLIDPKFKGYVFKYTMFDPNSQESLEVASAVPGDRVRFKYGDTKTSPTLFVKQFHDLDTMITQTPGQ